MFIGLQTRYCFQFLGTSLSENRFFGEKQLQNNNTTLSIVLLSLNIKNHFMSIFKNKYISVKNVVCHNSYNCCLKVSFLA